MVNLEPSFLHKYSVFTKRNNLFLVSTTPPCPRKDLPISVTKLKTLENNGFQHSWLSLLLCWAKRNVGLLYSVWQREAAAAMKCRQTETLHACVLCKHIQYCFDMIMHDWNRLVFYFFCLDIQREHSWLRCLIELLCGCVYMIIRPIISLPVLWFFLNGILNVLFVCYCTVCKDRQRNG